MDLKLNEYYWNVVDDFERLIRNGVDIDVEELSWYENFYSFANQNPKLDHDLDRFLKRAVSLGLREDVMIDKLLSEIEKRLKKQSTHDSLREFPDYDIEWYSDSYDDYRGYYITHKSGWSYDKKVFDTIKEAMDYLRANKREVDRYINRLMNL